MVLVSVIMPSFNHEKYISDAIESVLNQSFRDLELIIIDDYSKDRSREIIKIYDKKDERIRVIFHNENKGIAQTMNEGIKIARGKYIALFSSDDLWVKEKLEKQLKVLKKNENLIVWSEGEVIDRQGKVTGVKIHPRKKKINGYILEDLLKENYIFGLSVIFKKKNLRNIRYDERLKYLNDYKFMIDLAERYKYYYINEPLAQYRIHGKNIMLLEKDEWIKEWIKFDNYLCKKYGKKISKIRRYYLFIALINIYLTHNDKKNAIFYFYKAIKIKPLRCIQTMIFKLPKFIKKMQIKK